MAATKAWAGILPAVLLLAACQSTDGANVFDKPRDFFETQAKKIKTLGGENASEPAISQISKQKTLANILKGSAASVDLSKGFTKSIAAAVLSDPSVIAAADEVDALKARIESVQAQKEIQFSGTIYGGAEDISDKTSGLAAVLNANRVIYDGGKIDSQIEADKQRLMAAQYAFEARLNERALQLASIWIDLDRYGKLSTEIESRLMILNPLIEQLEKITTAGVGDVTQVAAAQRTVAEIRVIQTDVSERLAQTRVSFTNAFGRLRLMALWRLEFLKTKCQQKFRKTWSTQPPYYVHSMRVISLRRLIWQQSRREKASTLALRHRFLVLLAEVNTTRRRASV